MGHCTTVGTTHKAIAQVPRIHARVRHGIPVQTTISTHRPDPRRTPQGIARTIGVDENHVALSICRWSSANGSGGQSRSWTHTGIGKFPTLWEQGFIHQSIHVRVVSGFSQLV